MNELYQKQRELIENFNSLIAKFESETNLHVSGISTVQAREFTKQVRVADIEITLCP